MPLDASGASGASGGRVSGCWAEAVGSIGRLVVLLNSASEAGLRQVDVKGKSK